MAIVNVGGRDARKTPAKQERRPEADLPKGWAAPVAPIGRSGQNAKDYSWVGLASRGLPGIGYPRPVVIFLLVEDGFMPADIERRCVLAAAQPSHAGELRQLFAHAVLQSWHVLEADGLERARFLLLQDHCDILLVDESLYQGAGPAGLGWLTRQAEAPTVLLTGEEPNAIAAAFEQGVSLCLPRQLVLDNPHVLAAGLSRAADLGELQRRLRRSADRLHNCRRQVDRLVNLLWRNVPIGSTSAIGSRTGTCWRGCKRRWRGAAGTGTC